MPTRAQGRAVLASMIAIGCSASAPPSTYDGLPELRRIMSAYGLSAEPADVAMAHVAYRPPSRSCPQVYRLHASYEPAIKHEEDSTSHVVLGHEDRPRSPRPAPDVFDGQLVYAGVRAQRPIVRDWSLSSEMAGPAAPTAACFPRTWDPIDDAFALGWPRLPGGLTAVDHTWSGLRVEGKCNRSACIDPQTGGGGPDNHHRTCVTPSWQETLTGVYEIDGHRLALVRRHWSDGHGDDGIRTEGRALLSIDHGRPLWAQVVVHHGFPQLAADDSWAPITRTWTMEAIDDCPGSLPHLGWQRPPEIDEDLQRMLEAFDRADELRSGGATRKTTTRSGSEPSLEQPNADER
jgi:hypothetical protein